MKNYLKPITEFINVRSRDCFMGLAGSGEHGQVGAPTRKETPNHVW